MHSQFFPKIPWQLKYKWTLDYIKLRKKQHCAVKTRKLTSAVNVCFRSFLLFFPCRTIDFSGRNTNSLNRSQAYSEGVEVSDIKRRSKEKASYRSVVETDRARKTQAVNTAQTPKYQQHATPTQMSFSTVPSNVREYLVRFLGHAQTVMRVFTMRFTSQKCSDYSDRQRHREVTVTIATEPLH